MALEFDVAVIGGGPAASSLGTFLRKYDSEIRVGLFEREFFPRDHVGESQIPHLMPVLAEMDVWDKVEAAGFPIKIGGLYKWGTSDELWALDFFNVADFHNSPRPEKFEGVRRLTAFQVDRSIYDKVLLDHARSVGCTVYEGAKVLGVQREGDRVAGFKVLVTGEETEVKARWYIDASGNSGMLRRTMGVEIDSPTALRNIAVYDYWQNTEWAERIGVGGTRILTLSIACGWLWFIPIGPTRTSIGLVVPADHVKKTGKRPEQLYAEAIAAEPTISKLVANATCENIIQTTKDWSFVSERMFGENWFLVGDSAGFADPILSAGLTLAQSGSRNLAYTILAIDRKEHDAGWLKESYEQIQNRRIRNHIRFADFWYSANGHFSELKEYCAEIARNSGVKVTPEEAFVWMGSGGFANDDAGIPGAGTFNIATVKYNIRSLTGQFAHWSIAKFNSFRLDLEGATKEALAFYSNGKVHQIECYKRGAFLLPDTRSYGAMLAALGAESELELLIERFSFEFRRRTNSANHEYNVRQAVETLEAMLVEGWAVGEVAPQGRFIGFYSDPTKTTFETGWVEHGVGLMSMDPRSRGKVLVPWERFSPFS